MKKSLFLLIVVSASLLFSCSGNKGNLTSFDNPQEYVGEVVFENSKNVVLHFYLSADAKQITEIKLIADTLLLKPAISKSTQTGESIFKYSSRATLQTNMAIETNADGYNVAKLDANGNTIVESALFIGGFESTSPTDLKDDKISLTTFPLILDLTVTNTEISGNIKVELSNFTTKSVHAVFKNITE